MLKKLVAEAQKQMKIPTYKVDKSHVKTWYVIIILHIYYYYFFIKHLINLYYRYNILIKTENLFEEHFSDTIMTIAHMLAAIQAMAHVLNDANSAMGNFIHPLLTRSLPNTPSTASLYTKILQMDNSLGIPSIIGDVNNNNRLASRLNNDFNVSGSAMAQIENLLTPRRRRQPSTPPNPNNKQWSLVDILYKHYPLKDSISNKKLNWITPIHCHDFTYPYVFLYMYIYIYLTVNNIIFNTYVIHI